MAFNLLPEISKGIQNIIINPDIHFVLYFSVINFHFELTIKENSMWKSTDDKADSSWPHYLNHIFHMEYNFQNSYYQLQNYSELVNLTRYLS